MIDDKKIWKIIQTFASGDNKHGIWGNDTEIFSTKRQAIEAVRKILEDE